ncbi:hypothetical protein R3I94_009211 [Phoxinus phoxinus]
MPHTDHVHNPGCVWSVQSSEAEIWDVWTDIHCNDGLLLMDGQRHSPKPLRGEEVMANHPTRFKPWYTVNRASDAHKQTKPTHAAIKCRNRVSRDSNPGCVWSVQSSEAEIWDVWTDIHCNDGLLLMDGSASLTLQWESRLKNGLMDVSLTSWLNT